MLTCQFSGLETITAAVIDLFPRQMRRPWRREIFLIIFCSVLFLVQILLVTEVFTEAQLDVNKHHTEHSLVRFAVHVKSDLISPLIMCDEQGGVYLFQLIDFYAANGSCIIFGSFIHCVVVGWAFGKSYHLL